jgi:hypothetical protein
MYRAKQWFTGITMKKPKKSVRRAGRPPRHDDDRLRKNRTFRVSSSLDQRLQTAANQSGRSVSEEIEWRLDRSFDTSALVGTLLAGPENATRLLGLLARAMMLTPHWVQDNAERRRLQTVMELLIDATARGTLTIEQANAALGKTEDKLLALTLFNPHEYFAKPTAGAA